MNQRERIQQLEQELDELRARLARIEPIGGQPSAAAQWSVHVGGESIEIRALTPAQWSVALQDLPSFLFAYTVAQTRGDDANEELLQRLVQTAQQWIAACAIGLDAVRLDRLTIPEALDAIRKISALNGVDTALGEMLQKKLLRSTRSMNAHAAMESGPQRSSN